MNKKSESKDERKVLQQQIVEGRNSEEPNGLVRSHQRSLKLTFSQASMSRSRRSTHGVPKSCNAPFAHSFSAMSADGNAARNKHKKTRRSVAFASSPLKYISPPNEDSADCIFDGDEDDTEHSESESESESLFLWDEESTLLDALMDKPYVHY